MNTSRKALRMCATLCLVALPLASGCATRKLALSKAEFQALKAAGEVVVFNDGSPRLEYWTKGLAARYDLAVLPVINLIFLAIHSSAPKEAEEIGERKRVQWNLPDPGERIRERLIQRLRTAGVSTLRLVQSPRIEPQPPAAALGYRGRFDDAPTHAAPVELDRGDPAIASVAILGSGWMVGPVGNMWPEYRMVYFVTIHIARAPDLRWTTIARCFSPIRTLEQFEANDGALLRRASDELADACVEYLAPKILGDSP